MVNVGRSCYIWKKARDSTLMAEETLEASTRVTDRLTLFVFEVE